MKNFYSKMLIAAAVLFAANSALAADLYTSGDLAYMITKENTAMVAEPLSDAISGELVIPSTVKLLDTEYTVTGIAGVAFKDCAGITKVTLPNTIDSIEYQAFNGCTKLESINLQDTKIRTLCVSTFLYCSALKEITIPATVTTVETNPFMSTTSLKEITLAPGNTAYTTNDGILYTKDMKYLVCCPGGKTEAVIPEGVETIGTHSFKSTLVKTVKFPSSVKIIENYAFWQCGELTKIELPEKIEKIMGSAFAECKKATGEIILPETLKTLQTKAFYYTKISKIDIPKTITSIPANLCQYCVSMFTVVLHEGTTSIGNYAFNTCAVTSINIPNTVTKVGTSVFTGSTNLKEVTFGEKVSTIGTQTFYNLKGITKITCLGTTPPKIDDYASYPAFTSEVYANCQLIVPESAVDTYKEAATWKNFASIAASGVKDVENVSVAVSKVAGGIAILGAENLTAQIYNLNGVQVYNGGTGVVSLPAGNIYIVRVADKTYKIAL